MKKIYLRPVTKCTGIEINIVMQNMSNGGDKGGNWNGSAKDRNDWDALEGNEW